jgi:hypothetical protein
MFEIAIAPEFIVVMSLKAVSVTGLGGIYDLEILNIPHCIDNRLTGCGVVISLRLRTLSISQISFLLLVLISVIS